MSDILKTYPELKGLENEAAILNQAFEMEIPQIFQVDGASGGWSMYGGPLWVRPKQLMEFGVNLHQIVGHTPHKELTTYKNKKDFNIWMSDYIEYNDDLDFEPFILEV